MKENTKEQMNLSKHTLELIERLANDFVLQNHTGYPHYKKLEIASDIKQGAIIALTSPDILASAGLVRKEEVKEDLQNMSNNYVVLNGQYVIPKSVLDIYIENL